MEIAILVIINVVLASIFYLVISLKLERSASEFREKKLRREMDEIIREFNATAERNISILENKITAIKRLMEKPGDMKSVDIVLGDGDTQKESRKVPVPGIDTDVSDTGQVQALLERESASRGIMVQQPGSGVMSAGTISLKARNLLQGVRVRLKSLFERMSHGPINYPGHGPDDVTHKIEEKQNGIDMYDSADLITRDLVKPASDDNEDISDVADPGFPDDEEIDRLITSSDNKYTLVAELSSRGLTAEAISESSGIPVGEVRLVLNLNNSR